MNQSELRPVPAWVSSLSISQAFTIMIVASGFHADLGMVGTITVDGFSLADLMASNTLPESFQSGYAMYTYYSNLFYPDSVYDINLNGAESYTIFLPNDQAVDAITEDFGDPEISQFDMLGFIDLPAALRYSIVEGIYMAEDLQDGQLLMTTYGQNLTVSEINGAFLVDDATIISTNYTADNGVIHIIDKTLAPSGLPQCRFGMWLKTVKTIRYLRTLLT